MYTESPSSELDEDSMIGRAIRTALGGIKNASINSSFGSQSISEAYLRQLLRNCSTLAQRQSSDGQKIESLHWDTLGFTRCSRRQWQTIAWFFQASCSVSTVNSKRRCS